MIIAKNFATNYEKKYLEDQTLGQRVICPSKPAYYTVDCQEWKCPNQQLNKSILIAVGTHIRLQNQDLSQLKKEVRM